MRIFIYKFTTALYFIVGLLSVFLAVFFILRRNILLTIICALIAYVSFDNVFCKKRKARYCGS